MKLKSLFVVLALFAIGLLGVTAKTESGDTATFGWDASNANSILRANSSGDLVPGKDNSYDLGTASLSFKDIVADGTITNNGSLVVGDAPSDSFDFNGTTFTVNASTPGLNIASHTSVSGDSSFFMRINGASASRAVSFGVPVKLQQKTIAELDAIVPEIGDMYSCSDCSLTYSTVVGTGAILDGFRISGIATGPE